MRGKVHGSVALLSGVLSGCAGQPKLEVERPSDAVPAGCSERTPAPCETTCFSGDANACAIFGAAVEGAAEPPVRLPQDKPRGRKALDRGCRLGSLAACRLLASYDYEFKPSRVACGSWESLCARGEDRSCAFAAACLLYEEDYPRDIARGLDLLECNCQREERVACRTLGFVYREGNFVPRELAKGHALLARACEADDPLACAHVGRALELGSGVEKDLERAKALYRMSCARGIRPIPCEALRRLGETVPATVVSFGGASESLHASKEHDFEWRIPSNWEFVPPDAVGWTSIPGKEMVSARPRRLHNAESLTLVVRDVAAIVPGKFPDRDPSALDDLERAASEWMAVNGIEKVGSSRHREFGANAVRVVGRIPLPGGVFVTLTLFHRDRRRFELRCMSPEAPTGIPCRDAFGALVIYETEEKTVRAEVPRVLHLRDERFRLSYDAPDDDWQAVGPRDGFESRQLVWVWMKDGQQIDVSGLDLSGMAVLPSQDEMANRMVGNFRAKGATVTVKTSQLAGRDCAHIEIDQASNGAKQDMFIQRRGAIFYAVLVTASVRDPALLARSLAGLRISIP